MKTKESQQNRRCHASVQNAEDTPGCTGRTRMAVERAKRICKVVPSLKLRKHASRTLNSITALCRMGKR
jgi:hypothetical protein